MLLTSTIAKASLWSIRSGPAVAPSIIMSSIAGLRGSAGLAGYCATKGGVRLFAKAVAMECAAAGDGIRINTVHPGVIDTPIDPNEVARAGVPLGRAGEA